MKSQEWPTKWAGKPWRGELSKADERTHNIERTTQVNINNIRQSPCYRTAQRTRTGFIICLRYYMLNAYAFWNAMKRVSFAEMLAMLLALIRLYCYTIICYALQRHWWVIKIKRRSKRLCKKNYDTPFSFWWWNTKRKWIAVPLNWDRLLLEVREIIQAIIFYFNTILNLASTFVISNTLE